MQKTAVFSAVSYFIWWYLTIMFLKLNGLLTIMKNNTLRKISIPITPNIFSSVFFDHSLNVRHPDSMLFWVLFRCFQPACCYLHSLLHRISYRNGNLILFFQKPEFYHFIPLHYLLAGFNGIVQKVRQQYHDILLSNR